MNGSPESVGIMDSSCDSAVFYVYLNVRSWHKADRYFPVSGWERVTGLACLRTGRQDC